MSKKIVYVGSFKAKKSIFGLDYISNHIASKDLLVVHDNPSIEKQKKAKEKLLLNRLYNYFYNNYIISVAYRDLEEICVKKNLNKLVAKDHSLIDIENLILNFKPDYLLVNGWGWKISERILSIPNKKALNCHSSYLPFYRGASVYNNVLMNHEEYSGITVHEMTKRFDKGRIIKQCKVAIEKGETPNSLLEKLSKKSGKLLLDSVELIEHGYNGKLPKDKGFYAKKINNKTYAINYTKNKLRLLFGIKPKRYLIK